MSVHFDLVGRPYEKNVAVKDVIQAGYGKKSSYNNLKAAGYIKDSTLSNHNNQIYYNPSTKHLIHNVSGTHNVSDVITDAYLAFGKLKSTKRYKSSKDVLKKAKIKYGPDSKIDIAGHSLGGAIAQYIGSSNDHVTTVNKGATFGQKTRKNERAFRIENDPVSLLAAGSKRVQTIKNASNNKTLLGAHSSDALPSNITF